MFELRLFKKMRAVAIQFSKSVLKRLGIGITSYSNLVNLQKLAWGRSTQDLKLLGALTPECFEWIFPLLSESSSQLGQDLFVLSETQCKKGGFFVEFGATDGVFLSNTFLLETRFSWTGILAEPARVWEKQLRANRPSSSIETLCVWKNSNSILTFNETDIPELSTIDDYGDQDGHRVSRLTGKKYEVHTISLNDLLRKHRAPKYIDYLSIDTEGSEYEILQNFNFSEFSFGIITIEHNNTKQRDLIFDLLTSNGYRRKHEDISLIDDWYVKI
jgi:FkbM family methyltransferase